MPSDIIRSNSVFLQGTKQTKYASLDAGNLCRFQILEI